MSREYEMRCPKCGGDHLLAPATCFVEVSRLDDEGNLRFFPGSTSGVETDFDGQFLCGNPKCAARFWETDLRFEVGGRAGASPTHQEPK